MRSAPNANGLYVHIPFCDGKCAYCAFYSVRYEPVLADRYLAGLARELDTYGPLAPETLYIGGGTPSALSARQLETLGRLIRERCNTRRLAEWSVEVNPGSLDAEKAAVLSAIGVTRFSVGAQSFDDRILNTLGRRHRAEDIGQAVAVLRAAGAANIGLDLIACVPGGSAALWRETLRQAVALAPSHVSIYALTREEGTRLHRMIGRGRVALLSDDEQLAMLDLAEAELTRAGFRRYEISNYARKGFECRHHVACWRGERYLGIGPAAASHVGLRRWTNRPDVGAYLAAIEAGRRPPRTLDVLTPALKRQEQVIFGLRMAEGVAADIASDYRKILDSLWADGLVDRDGDRWVLTARGRNLADYVAVELMR